MTPMFILCLYWASSGLVCQPETPLTIEQCEADGRQATDPANDTTHQHERGYHCVPVEKYKT